ncbi:MAG TPA: flagellin [Arsenophonus sp.]
MFVTPATAYTDYDTTVETTAMLKDDQHLTYPAGTTNNALDANDIKITAVHAASRLATTSTFIQDFKLHQKIDKTTSTAIDGQYVVVVGTGANAKTFEANLTPGATNGNAKKLDIMVGAEITGAQAGTVGTALSPAPLPAGMVAADKVLSSLDDILTSVSALSSSLDVMQNRFEAAVENLNNTINNLSSTRSCIQDADFADEVSHLSNGQILQQAGTTVLAMANQFTQSVLSLLC